jgi:hypothetical protein
VEEETVVAAVTNLKVDIAGMPSFRPTGVSRVAVDVPILDVSSGGVTAFAAGSPQFPPFTLMLGPDAPFVALRAVWANALIGQLAPLNLTVTLQVPVVGKIGQNGYADLAWFEIENGHILGFSDGTVSQAYIVIQPGAITTLHQAPGATLNTVYTAVDLPVLSSPALRARKFGPLLGVYQTSGGDQSIALNGGVVTVGPLADVSVIAVARPPGAQLQPAVLEEFDLLRQQINNVLSLGKPIPTLEFTSLSSAGSVLTTVELTDCIPSRITLINPVLVNANGGLAPYVFDLRLKPTSVQ